MNFYIHIPFCRQKCPYCKFALTPVFDEVKRRRYLAHGRKEIKAYLEQLPSLKASTLYFGGGTPSMLSLDEVSELTSLFPKQKNAEISFECNPEDITGKYVKGLLDVGVNRLSIGVQSLSNETLKAIHRSDRESIFRALDHISSILYTHTHAMCSTLSINIDFILGLPYMKKGDTLESILALHKKYPFITHTSVYMLEDGLYPKDWKDQSICEEDMEEEYGKICEYFESIDWHHYEISNWAKPGYECRHNQGYWTHTDYRGFGLSATSYQSGKRWENSHSFWGYYKGEHANEEILTEEQIKFEKIIHKLRTFSLSIEDFDRSKVGEMRQKGYIKIEDNKIILTPTGIFRENFILSEILPP